LQAAGCALSWCYPIKNVIRKINVFFDEEGVNVFIVKTAETAFGQEFVNC